MHKSRKLAAKHRPIRRDARGAHCGQRHTVIRVFTGDDLRLLRLPLCIPEESRSLDRAVISFTSARSEEKSFYRRIGERGELLAELHGGNARAAGVAGSKGQLFHLAGSRLRQFLSPMADV